MKIKDVLKKYLSEERIMDIQDFVEELYQKEFDWLILMARKFFNLFCVFHEMNCEEYREMGVLYEQNDKHIATNRALPLLKYILSNTENMKYKKIIIADDIIIHGRSIRAVYNDIEKVCPDIDIHLSCYMQNEGKKSECDDIADKVWKRYVVNADTWRKTSDEIVQIFYLSGRPYISYLPYYTIDINWSQLLEGLEPEQKFDISCDDMRYYKVQSFMYTGKEFNKFLKLSFVKTCCVRLYNYPYIDKILIIPYCSVDMIEDKYLYEISDLIREQCFTEQYRNLVHKSGGADAMRIMEVEYLLSCLVAETFFRKHNVQKIHWNRDIEKYNFIENILSEQCLNEENISELVQKLEKVEFKPIQSTKRGIDETLQKRYKELKKKYFDNLFLWEKRSNHSAYGNYIQRFMENYLKENGRVDEEEYREFIRRKKEFSGERHFGLPISEILNDMHQTYEKWGEESAESCMQKCYAAMLCAADSGKGTIVTRHCDDIHLSESLIYAGEQNYKFYENTNFPFLYGLYIIEKMGSKDIISQTSEKERFKEKYKKYLDKNRIFYMEEEILQILEEEDIGMLYGQFLMNSYNKHKRQSSPDKLDLAKAVDEAMKICGY